MHPTETSNEPSTASIQQQEQRQETAPPLPTAPSADPTQERMAILRMIAEGRITPDEGDLLLEALGN